MKAYWCHCFCHFIKSKSSYSDVPSQSAESSETFLMAEANLSFICMHTYAYWDKLNWQCMCLHMAWTVLAADAALSIPSLETLCRTEWKMRRVGGGFLITKSIFAGRVLHWVRPAFTSKAQWLHDLNLIFFQNWRPCLCHTECVLHSLLTVLCDCRYILYKSVEYQKYLYLV